MTKSKLAATAAAVLLAGALAACAKPEAAKVDTAKVAETIRADVTQLVTEMNAKDADKAVAHDAEGYVFMFHGAPNSVGVASDKEFTTQLMTDPNLKLAATVETVDVAEAGDMAVVRSTYDFTFTDPATKAATTEHGNWVLGYKKQADGGYKLAWSVVSDSPAAEPAAVPAAK
jgi:ketosteroid isomerase-like protein